MMHALRRSTFLIKNSRSIQRVGKGLLVYGKVMCIGKKLFIGDFVSLNEGVFLNAAGPLRIGNHCTLSPFVQIHTGGLTTDRPYRERTHVVKPVHLEDGVWLCAGVIVTSGVTIGEGSVVAAGSVVTKDIPKFELWGGAPAQKIKSLKQP